MGLRAAHVKGRDHRRYERVYIMLTSVRLQNYKCFADTGTLRIAPLTILVGENNSGKSSLLHALQLFAVTAQTRDPDSPLRLVGADYDFGSFEDLAIGHRKDVEIGFSFGCEGHTEPWLPGGSSGDFSAVFDLRFCYLPRRREIHLGAFAIRDDEGEFLHLEADRYDKRLSGRLRRHCDLFEWAGSGAFWRRGFVYLPNYEMLEQRRTKQGKKGKPIDWDLFGDMNRVAQMVTQLERDFRNTHHLGPLRSPPKRAYLYSGGTPRSVGPNGESALLLYSVLATRRGAADAEVVKRIDEALYQLGFVNEFGMRPVGKRWHEFWTRHKQSGLDASLADTGFGASQVLPVIISAYASGEGATLLYEQPEIHLHPAAQAELGSVLADAVSDGKRIVIETHSENLILRVLREIADPKRRLCEDDVAFYYTKPTTEGHEVVQLPVDASGRFVSAWPKGFFAEGFHEAQALTLLQTERRQDASGRD